MFEKKRLNGLGLARKMGLLPEEIYGRKIFPKDFPDVLDLKLKSSRSRKMKNKVL